MRDLGFHDTAEIVNPETHHEKTDVSVRALIWFAVIFVIFGFVTHFTIWFMFKVLAGEERQRNTGPLTSMQRPADMSVPQNQPLLQPFPRKTQDGEVLPPNRNTPVTDLADMREAERRALTSYGWVDQRKGIVHIPIDEAMKLTVQRLSGGQAPPPVPTGEAPVAPQGARP
ncbi:MAG TPA: hypothetical protein VGS96_12630 [Thermoanaerobaculia bacterium]|nr:hypothetical protein [Thermoanaerobaculia bacterium]